MTSLIPGKIYYTKNELDIYFKIKSEWQLGAWEELAKIDSLVKDDHPNFHELKTIHASACLQLGEFDKAISILKMYDFSQVEISILLSGVYNSLGRARAVKGESELAYRHFSHAIDIYEKNKNNSYVKQSRMLEQYAQLGRCQYWKNIDNINGKVKNKKLFIDCGGYDGCSVIKFLLQHPDYDVITFEANPELWSYHENLPNTLIKKAVYDYEGFIEFTLDPIDADGSSIIKDKKIDFNGKVKNEDCPKLEVPCVNLSNFILEQSLNYSHIELKLDVEGAEYAVLELMLKEKTLQYVKKLYAEFHWNKINLTKEYHDDLLSRVALLVPVEDWDAQEFGVHKRDKSARNRRKFIEKILL